MGLQLHSDRLYNEDGAEGKTFRPDFMGETLLANAYFPISENRMRIVATSARVATPVGDKVQ